MGVGLGFAAEVSPKRRREGYLQRGIFSPGLSLSSPLANADRIALTTISHSISITTVLPTAGFSPRCLGDGVELLRQRKGLQAEILPRSASGKDGQHTCRAWLAGTRLAPPALAVFSSGRSPLCMLRMPSQQLQPS